MPRHRDLLDNRPNPNIPRDPMHGLPYTDIWENIPKFPRRVYIVGSGPNGRDQFRKIPQNAFCIALNSMILFWRKWDWWMVFDHRVVDSDWWTDATSNLGKRTRIIFGARLANRVWSDDKVFPRIHPHFYFRYHPGMSGASFVPGQPLLMPGLLRGLTVAGCALQFAYYGGAKEVLLCGIDMFGQDHIDGHRNVDKVYLKEWPWAKNLSKLCAHLKTQGMEIKTISETALTEVPLCTI
jgi:hypothetical protein